MKNGIWQDKVIAAAQLVFAASLVPTAFTAAAAQMPLLTSGPTAGGMLAIAVCMGSLRLPFSFATSFAGFILWLLIFVRGAASALNF
jgi:hypothetical protein